MIIIYPMLVSKSISENIVPGITKTIESYIIVNAADTIISNPAVKHNYNFKIKGRNLVLKENENIIETTEDDLYGKSGRTKEEAKKEAERERVQRKRDAIAWAQDEKRRRAAEEREKAQDQRDKNKSDREQKKFDREAERETEKYEREKEDLEAKTARVDVSIKDNKALSIEPSFIEIETFDKAGNPIKSSIGVKVIAIRIKSDSKLSRLILHDTQLNFFNAKMTAFGRSILRRVWKFIDKWFSWEFNEVTPTGDLKHDIIMGRTGHKGEGFVVLSKSEDIDDTFLDNISRINRLFKMGWGNIIIVDDINRVAHFCMKKFKGSCTTISFAMIYQNFGTLKVYQDLEDAKRQTSSIFKISKPLSKVIAEWVTDYRQKKYLSEDK